jgi:hypothetical protein
MMRKWLAGKFFNLAVWLDWDVVLLNSLAVLFIEAGKRRLIEPKKKRGRPLGSKDGVARKVSVAPKKRGRPLGSKNKPKV